MVSPSSMAAPPYPRAYSISSSGGPSSSGGYLPPPPMPPPQVAGSKRAHDQTFGVAPRRYQNGARQREPLDDVEPTGMEVFEYRRADGTFERKQTHAGQ